MKEHKSAAAFGLMDQTRIAAVDSVFSESECRSLIKNFVPRLKPASVDALSVDESRRIRKSSADFIAPSESTRWIFERVMDVIGEVNRTAYGFDLTEFREGFQFTRYEAGEFYKPHLDIGPGRLAERKLSLTVQLSSEQAYDGGELIIYPDFVASKMQGTMTVFPSFMCHNVNPVTRGTRYSLVSWVAGPSYR